MSGELPLFYFQLQLNWNILQRHKIDQINIKAPQTWVVNFNVQVLISTTSKNLKIIIKVVTSYYGETGALPFLWLNWSWWLSDDWINQIYLLHLYQALFELLKF